MAAVWGERKQSPQSRNKAGHDNFERPEKCFHHIKNYQNSRWNLLGSATKNPPAPEQPTQVFGIIRKALSFVFFLDLPLAGPCCCWAARQVAGDGSSSPVTFSPFTCTWDQDPFETTTLEKVGDTKLPQSITNKHFKCIYSNHRRVTVLYQLGEHGHSPSLELQCFSAVVLLSQVGI